MQCLFQKSDNVQIYSMPNFKVEVRPVKWGKFAASSAKGLKLADARVEVNLLTMSVRYDTKYKRM